MIVSPPNNGRGYHYLAPPPPQHPHPHLPTSSKQSKDESPTASPQPSPYSSQAPSPRSPYPSSPYTPTPPHPPPSSKSHSTQQNLPTRSPRQRASSTSAAVTAIAEVPLLGIPRAAPESCRAGAQSGPGADGPRLVRTHTTPVGEGVGSGKEREDIQRQPSQHGKSQSQGRGFGIGLRKEGQGLRQAGQSGRRPSQARVLERDRGQRAEPPTPRSARFPGEDQNRSGTYPPVSGRKASNGYTSDSGHNPREGRRQAGTGAHITQAQTQAAVQDMSSKGGKKVASQSFKFGYSTRAGNEPQPPAPPLVPLYHTSHNISTATASSSSSAASGGPQPPTVLPTGRVRAASSAGASIAPSQTREREPQGTVQQPVFKYEGGRRWLRDPTITYPLPVDLQEIHRQNLKLILQMRLMGAPFCNDALADFDSSSSSSSSSSESEPDDSTPKTSKKPHRRKRRSSADLPPLKVLEVACGSALWSSSCAKYFAQHTRRRVHFTGIDMAPVSPDLSQAGVHWRFVQHDMRVHPWPFASGEFDLVFVKDSAFCGRSIQFQSNPIVETGRVVKAGGVLEIWEADHVFRTLRPHPQLPPGTPEDDAEQAAACGAFVMNSGTPFAASHNRFLADYNVWVEAALAKRDLSAAPCTLVEWALRVEEDRFKGLKSRRLALPLGETRWEKETGKRLSPQQASLRHVAALTTVQFVEAMEGVLRAESGKSQDEWDRWWAGMAGDLLEGGGTSSGECLEVGAWWAVKSR